MRPDYLAKFHSQLASGDEVRFSYDETVTRQAGRVDIFSDDRIYNEVMLRIITAGNYIDLHYNGHSTRFSSQPFVLTHLSLKEPEDINERQELKAALRYMALLHNVKVHESPEFKLTDNPNNIVPVVAHPCGTVYREAHVSHALLRMVADLNQVMCETLQVRVIKGDGDAFCARRDCRTSLIGTRIKDEAAKAILESGEGNIFTNLGIADGKLKAISFEGSVLETTSLAIAAYMPEIKWTGGREERFYLTSDKPEIMLKLKNFVESMLGKEIPTAALNVPEVSGMRMASR